MKFLIFKRTHEGLGNKLNSYESSFKDDTSKNRSEAEAEPKAIHLELPEGLDEDCVIPVWMEIQPEQVVTLREPVEAQEQVLDPETGEIIQDAIPAQEGLYATIPAINGWTLELDPQLVNLKILSNKAQLIADAKTRMDVDVYTEMAQVFGTSNPESANAYSETYKLMKEYPDQFIGDDFSTEAEVLAYANAKLAQILAYAKSRMARIKQFKQEVLDIQNS